MHTVHVFLTRQGQINTAAWRTNICSGSVGQSTPEARSGTGHLGLARGNMGRFADLVALPNRSTLGRSLWDCMVKARSRCRLMLGIVTLAFPFTADTALARGGGGHGGHSSARSSVHVNVHSGDRGGRGGYRGGGGVFLGGAALGLGVGAIAGVAAGAAYPAPPGVYYPPYPPYPYPPYPC